MVIEYAGTVIRSILTDKREKMYDAKVRRGLRSGGKGLKRGREELNKGGGEG